MEIGRGQRKEFEGSQIVGSGRKEVQLDKPGVLGQQDASTTVTEANGLSRGSLSTLNVGG